MGYNWALKKSNDRKNKSKGQRAHILVQGNLNTPLTINPNTTSAKHDDSVREQGCDSSHPINLQPPDHWDPNKDIAPDFMEDNGTTVLETQFGADAGDAR